MIDNFENNNAWYSPNLLVLSNKQEKVLIMMDIWEFS